MFSYPLQVLLSELLTFEPKGLKSLARHHNWLTGGMLNRAIWRDQERIREMQWRRETIEQDLSVLITRQHAQRAMELMRYHKIAGNFDELQKTRQLLAHADTGYQDTDQGLALQKEQLDQKLLTIALQLHKKSRREADNKWRTSVPTAVHARTGMAEDARTGMAEDVSLLQQCLIKVLRPRQSGCVAGGPALSVLLPATPSILALPSFDPDTLQVFLTRIQGDLADKAKFAKYAGKIREMLIDGSGVRDFGETEMEAMNVALGDREALRRGMMLLYRIFEAGDNYKYPVCIRVLKASNLPRMDVTGTCDAYCVIRLDDCARGNRQEFKSTYYPDSLNPRWGHQEFRLRVAEMAAPGDLSVTLFDHDDFGADQRVGTYLLGEARIGQVYSPAAAASDDVLNFADILRRLLEKVIARESLAQLTEGGNSRVSEVYVEEELALSFDGQPVVGDNMQRTSVTLAFSLPEGSRREHKIPLMQREYPHHAGTGNKRVLLDVRQQELPVIEPSPLTVHGTRMGQHKGTSPSASSVWKVSAEPPALEAAGRFSGSPGVIYSPDYTRISGYSSGPLHKSGVHVALGSYIGSPRLISPQALGSTNSSPLVSNSWQTPSGVPPPVYAHIVGLQEERAGFLHNLRKEDESWGDEGKGEAVWRSSVHSPPPQSLSPLDSRLDESRGDEGRTCGYRSPANWEKTLFSEDMMSADTKPNRYSSVERKVERTNAQSQKQLVIKDAVTKETAKRVGLQLAAEIDAIARICLPFVFVAYFGYEVSSVFDSGADFLSSMSLNVATAQVTFVDNRTHRDYASCHRNTGFVSESTVNLVESIIHDCPSDFTGAHDMERSLIIVSSPFLYLFVMSMALGLFFPLRSWGIAGYRAILECGAFNKMVMPKPKTRPMHEGGDKRGGGGEGGGGGGGGGGETGEEGGGGVLASDVTQSTPARPPAPSRRGIDVSFSTVTAHAGHFGWHAANPARTSQQVGRACLVAEDPVDTSSLHQIQRAQEEDGESAHDGASARGGAGMC